MAKPLRVVRYGATGHRVMRHPSPTQTMTAARAAMTGALARGQGGPFNDPFDPGNQIPGSGAPGSDDLGGIDDPLGLQSRIAELLGMSAPLRPGDFFSPVGGGTLAGALLSRTGAGRALMGLANSGYENFGQQSWGGMFGPGGHFAGRGTAGQWASDNDLYGNQSIWSLMKDWRNAKVTLAVDQAVFDAFQSAGLLNPAAAGAANAAIAMDQENVRASWQKLDARWKQDLHAASNWWSHTFGGGADPDWVISPRGRAGLNSGYYPTVSGPSSGRLSPLEAARLMHRLAYSAKHEGWWGGQWVHLGAGPGSGAGHGPKAPASVVLGGRKHPYDWVALSTHGPAGA